MFLSLPDIKLFLCSLGIILFIKISPAQDTTIIDYERNQSKYQSIQEVSNEIIDSKMNNLDKIHAIFNWTTHNIKYDCKLKHKNEKVRAKNRKLRKRKKKRRKQYKNYSTLEIVNRGQGVCSDYSQVFNELCKINDIESSIISGYGRTLKKKIGIRFASNHAWNKVILDDTAYYIDATWSSGYSAEDCNKFYHRPDSSYYLIPESTFRFSHFPYSKSRDSIYLAAKEYYFDLPLIHRGFYINKIEDFSPKNGIIKMSLDSTIAFTFKSENPLVFYDVQSSREDYSKTGDLLQEESMYSFDFKPSKYGYQYITIWINSKAVASYKVYVKR